MKKPLQTLLLLLICVIAQAQQFTKKAAFPGPARWASYSFMLGGKLYMGGGLDTTIVYGDLWMYDAVTNAWSKKQAPPFAARTGAVAVVIGGKAYAGFGRDSVYGSGGTADYGFGYSLKDWWLYNDATDTWTQKASLPAEARHNPSVVAWNGKAYLTGGNNYQDAGAGHGYRYHSEKDMWEYNPTTDTWTRQPDFPHGARSRTYGQVIGDTLFYGLGQEDSSFTSLADNYRYNLVSKTWSAMPALPPTMTLPVADGWCWFSASWAKKIVLMNLNVDGKDYNDWQNLYVFDASANSWTVYEDKNVPGFRAGSAFGQNGSKAYLASGWDYYLDEYKTDTWELNLSAFLAVAESANPLLAQIMVGSSGRRIKASVPEGLLQKGAAELALCDNEGKLLATYPLSSEKTMLDAGLFPPGVYNYVVRISGRPLKGGAVALY